MRFSSLFQLPAVTPQPARVRDLLPTEKPGERPSASAPAAKDLPDDLDARVRLVGEWQLGDAI